MRIQDYSRIIIVGSPGSGKSTLAKRLGTVVDLPVIHLDKIFWNPGWVETPREEFILKQQKLLSTEKWIIDGNYNGTLEMRFAAADLIIFLDINRLVCLLSALKRRRKKHYDDLPVTEPRLFSKDYFEFLKFIWKFPKHGRKQIIKLQKQYGDKAFLRLKSRKEIRKYLKSNG